MLYEVITRITQNLVNKAGLPMPKVYVIPDHTPNAFATGRNHENAAVAVTMGLYEMLNDVITSYSIHYTKLYEAA